MILLAVEEVLTRWGMILGGVVAFVLAVAFPLWLRLYRGWLDMRAAMARAAAEVAAAQAEAVAAVQRAADDRVARAQAEAATRAKALQLEATIVGADAFANAADPETARLLRASMKRTQGVYGVQSDMAHLVDEVRAKATPPQGERPPTELP